MALAFPARRARRWVPPAPGSTPSFTSGRPKRALSAAMMKSHISASSKPPPRVWPATAAMIGLRRSATRSQRPRKSSR
ncbi:hypothetical protein D9M71_604360 [compost metagenome]